MRIPSAFCIAASLLLPVQILKSQEPSAGTAKDQVVVYPNFLDKSGIQIISATYGSGVSFSDVTEETIKLFNQQPKFYASPEWLHADPTPGWNKALVIIFKWQDHRYLFSSGEGGLVNLPQLKSVAARQEAADHAKWLEICLKDFESIAVGMTRSEVQTKLSEDGGLQTVSPVRFTHPACPSFKIDVEFDFGRDPADQNRAVWGKDDKVNKVSKPYIERPADD